MSAFTTPLKLEFLDGTTWVVMEPFHYWLKEIGDQSEGLVAVPKGFRTDFASVPRGLWNIFPPTGEYGKAAVIHDALYASEYFERSRCDAIFKEAMEVLGVQPWKRWSMYLAVRAAGWLVWKNHDQNEVKRVRELLLMESLKVLDPLV